MGKHSCDGVLKIVASGPGALSANVNISIVDAAKVDDTQSMLARISRNQDCGLGRDRRMHGSEKPLARLHQSRPLKAVGRLMLDHALHSLSSIRIDQPESDRLSRELLFQSLNFRRVAIGDGTIGRNKKQHDSLVL